METVREWSRSSQGAVNLVVQTIAILGDEHVLNDVGAVAIQGDQLLDLTARIKAYVEAPSDLQQRAHWAQFLNLTAEIGEAAKTVPQTLDVTPLGDLQHRLAAEIGALSQSTTRG